METLHNEIFKNLAEKIKNALKIIDNTLVLDTYDIYTQISTPPNLNLGDFCFPCFSLAKTLKKSPQKIAEELKEKISIDNLISEVIPEGPYVNFKLTSNTYDKILENILNDSFFSQKLKDNPKKKMFEYSQPNTHKDLHVGHMRNLCFGNSLVKLSQYIGDTTVSATYPGDHGTHVAKCLWFLKYHNKQSIPENDKGTWLSHIYIKANTKLKEEENTPQEAINKNELTEILKQLSIKKGDFFELWKETKQWSIDLMNEIYSWADVKFDKWYFESEVDKQSIEMVQKYYKKGILTKSDGAIGADLKDDKLGFCILIKSDGNGMYATKDLALAHNKFEEFNLDESLYLVDKRQALHFKQVFKVLERINFPYAKNCFHLQYDFVELPSGMMSSRTGVTVQLKELINNMEMTIKKQYLNKYIDEWSEQEINDTAHIIADGAIKYGMLQMDSTRIIVFKMDEWLKLEGETGPYLQYVYARIRSLLTKQSYKIEDKIDCSLLTQSIEKELMIQISIFNSAVYKAAYNYRPNHLCSYLYSLGKLFNSFYASCPIGKLDNLQLKAARLSLANATALTMKNGLLLLGIKTPEKM